MANSKFIALALEGKTIVLVTLQFLGRNYSNLDENY